MRAAASLNALSSFLSLSPSFYSLRLQCLDLALSSFLLSIHKAGCPTKQGSQGKKEKNTLSKLPGSISLASCGDCVARGCGKLDLGVSLSTSVHEIRH